MLNFPSEDLNNDVQAGKIVDRNLREYIRDALGITQKLVESSRHTVISGPQGVGKTYGTIDECERAGIEKLIVAPGTSDVALAVALATKVYQLGEDDELVVILDDADDVVFGDYGTLNKWKIALAEPDYNLGIMPFYNHNTAMTGTINAIEKQAQADPRHQSKLEALNAYLDPNGLGLSIPTEQVRFVILCNRDFEDPKQLPRGKLGSAIPPVLDRMNYERINLSMEKQWGWNAYVLGTTQPFDNYHLSDEQKIELLMWMRNNWNSLRSKSYRSIRRLAEAMINNPDRYWDIWKRELRGV